MRLAWSGVVRARLAQDLVHLIVLAVTQVKAVRGVLVAAQQEIEEIIRIAVVATAQDISNISGRVEASSTMVLSR